MFEWVSSLTQMHEEFIDNSTLYSLAYYYNQILPKKVPQESRHSYKTAGLT
jgi:hypothetical protein